MVEHLVMVEYLFMVQWFVGSNPHGRSQTFTKLFVYGAVGHWVEPTW